MTCEPDDYQNMPDGNEAMVLLYLTPISAIFSTAFENGIVVYMAAMHQCERDYLEPGSEQEGVIEKN